MVRPTLRAAIKHVNSAGALLLFPIKTNLSVPSLWKRFFPHSKMEWDWSEDGNDKVPQLWHLREELSRCREVVYAKWFQGRATFFSPEVFTALLSASASQPDPLANTPEAAKRIYRALLDDSPLATKALRFEAGFEGRENEAEYQRGLKALWRRLLIIGYGEVDEGGFPSLAVGCVKHLFEEIWHEASVMTNERREEILTHRFSANSPFLKTYRTISRSAKP